MKMRGVLGLRHGSRARVLMSSGRSPHPCGGQRFEPDMPLPNPYPADSFSLPPLSVFLDLFSLPLPPWLWQTFETWLHWSCKGGLLCSCGSERKGGGCRRIQKHYEGAWTHGIYSSWGQPVSWSLTRHSGVRYCFFLLLLLCFSRLPSTWPVPGNHPVPLDLSPSLLTNILISWAQIIKLYYLLTWKIQRLAWQQSTTFSTVD